MYICLLVSVWVCIYACMYLEAHDVIPISVSAYRYSNWDCGNSTCLGVGMEVNHHDTSEDPYSSDTTRASDVIEVSLFNQNSGRNLSSVPLARKGRRGWGGVGRGRRGLVGT